MEDDLQLHAARLALDHELVDLLQDRVVVDAERVGLDVVDRRIAGALGVVVYAGDENADDLEVGSLHGVEDGDAVGGLERVEEVGRGA